MGRRPRDLLDPASMDPEQVTSTPTQQDLLNEEILKLAMRTHFEVQRREDIRRDLAERMKFVPLARRSEQMNILHFSCCRAFEENPTIVVMSPTVATKSYKQQEVIWQQYHLCSAVVEHHILGGKSFLILGTETGRTWWLKKVHYLQKKYHCQWTFMRGKIPKWIFHKLGNLLRPLESIPVSRERVVPAE